ncbi:MAG: AbrB/MazE/SpoVT family DNA-binding domain-containing protein [Desulfobacterales bacterium]|nr:AbrB/MazE/SpoVT family DNA-binding domain-containing protein [Desulfobacterales bacterium]
MALATLTTKGQVTIPKKIREALKLHAGDKIDIIVTENREAIIKPVSRKVDDLFCKLHKPGRKAVSLEAMDDAVRNRMKIRRNPDKLEKKLRS